MDQAEVSSSGSDMEMGYDMNFDPELDGKYQCPICLLALREPVQTKCGHRFCKRCLDKSAGTRRIVRCPVDKTWLDSLQDVFVDVAVQREVLSLTVVCSNQPDGCPWKGELRDQQSHLRRCPVTVVQCPRGCDSPSVRRGSLDEHLTVCPRRIETCAYCAKALVASELTKHQLLVCEKFPVSCGVCGESGIIRESVAQHVDPTEGTCPLVTVSCAFGFVGCTFQDKRNNMVLHYENACHQHMMLLCSTLAVQYEQLRTQQRQLDALSVQCSALADASRESSRLGSQG